MRKQIIRNLAKDDEYTVEEIIGKRRRGNKVEYLVKWQDYPEDESTWEPIENLINVWELIEDYEKTLMDDEKAKKKFRIKPQGSFPSGNPKRSRPFPRRHEASDFEYEEDVMEEEEVSNPREFRQSGNSKEQGGKESRFENRLPWLSGDNMSRTMGKQFRLKPKNLKYPRAPPETNLEPELKISSDEEERNIPEVGDFRYGDHARQILSCKPKGGDILVNIEWHPRSNKTVPKNTTMPTSIVKKYDPELLIDFYETKLRFVPKSEENNIETKQESPEKQTQSTENKEKPLNEQPADSKEASAKPEEKATNKKRSNKAWTTSKEIEAN